MLNKVQKAAYDLIQSDARFIYTLVDMQNHAKNINSNYVMMCQPYIGIFADGAEQWCKKTGMDAPKFNNEEKGYYVKLRQAHKLFEWPYKKYEALLTQKFQESDRYFYNIRSLFEKIIGYSNVGVDYCNGTICGNTILCAMYMPFSTLGDKKIGPKIRDLSIVAGKLAAYFLDGNMKPFAYDDKNNTVKYRDYHFYKRSPLILESNLGFVLFCIMCSINYITEFIDKYFVEEIPQKFKYAYLQYYYICDFLEELNIANKTNYYIDNELKNRSLRNCFAHYGLGQFLKEIEVNEKDVLKGLTEKAFNMENLGSIHRVELWTMLQDSILFLRLIPQRGVMFWLSLSTRIFCLQQFRSRPMM